MGAAGVGFAFGPYADTAYEMTAPTPVSTLARLIVRLAAVSAAVSIIVGIGVTIASFARPSSDIAQHAFAWLLPMLASSLLAAAVASKTKPFVGAVIGIGCWLAFISLLHGVVNQPVDRVWGAESQIGYGVVIVAMAFLLYRWSEPTVMPLPRGPWEA